MQIFILFLLLAVFGYAMFHKPPNGGGHDGGAKKPGDKNGDKGSH